MSIYASLNGNITDAKDAAISILDRGFLYGDSVYEVLRTCDNKAFALPEHLHRMRQSAETIFLPINRSDRSLTRELEALLAHAMHPEESYIRIVVTRGASSDIGLDPALALTPTYLFLVKPYPKIPSELYTKGARVVFIHQPKNPHRGIKTGNYLSNILALREARAKNAYEGWLVDDGKYLSEGANSNLFLVKDHIVQTPPISAGLLNGITRQKILWLCHQEGITYRETPLTTQDALTCDEAFITSTLREVMPITQIEEHKPNQATPGPITERLRLTFRKMAGGRAP